MKRALLWLSFTLAATGVLLLYPESTHALNPNHQCSFCHGLHSAPGTQLKKDADVEVLCLTCHGPAGISIFKADVHTNDTPTSYAAFSITCMRCHNPHSDRVNWLGSHNH
ncbi:MAG: cytochrome c3 family protein, partial [Acidobacteriota bacterium]